MRPSNIRLRHVAGFVLAALMVVVGFHSASASTLLAAVPAITPSDFAGMATTDVQETFKRVYLMAADAIPDSTPLTAQLQRTKKFKPAADYLYFNVKLESGGAVANVNGALALPRATHPKRKQGRIGLAHTYTVVAIDGQSISLTDDTRNAFVSNLEDQLEDGLFRVKIDVERQYNTDGSGILCLVQTVGGAPTYGVYRPCNVVNGGPGTLYLIEDMDVTFINPGTGLERGRAKIAAGGVDITNDQVTLSGAIAGAQIGDYVCLCNDVGATGADQANNYLGEAAGIKAVCQSANTFENISGVTYRRWNATVMSNGGTTRPITEKLVRQMEARVKASCGKKPDLLYTTEGVSIELEDQLSGLRRFTGETVELPGGFEGVKLGKRTLLTGDMCLKGHLYGISTGADAAGTLDLAKMGYTDLDGAKLHRTEGRHAYRADLWFPHNVAWFSRNAHGVITDLEDDNTIRR
jgi:hypothetical protein